MSVIQSITAAARRRDFNLGVLNGVLFGGVDTLFDPSLVLVTFASFLTDSPILLGLVYPMSQAGWFLPQLWVSGWFQSKPTALPIYRVMAVIRTICLVLLALTAYAVEDKGWQLFLFFTLLMANQLAAGFSGLSFMDVVAKVVPPGERGLFFAWRLSLGSLLGVGAGVWVRSLLSETSPIRFPNNFALMFAVASVLAAAGMAAFAALREPINQALVPRASLIGQLRRARTALQTDPNFRGFLGLRLALIGGSMATPFFTVFAAQRLQVAAGAVGIFLSANIAASLVAYIVWGQLSARRGNRFVLRIGAGLGVLVLAFALMAWPLSRLLGAQTLIVLIFILVGVRDAAVGVSLGPLLLDMAPPAARSLYIGFTNTLVGITVLLTGIGGFIVDGAGFPALFVISLLAYAAATWAIWRFREQPLPG